MASVLRQLKDDDLDDIHRLIRKDALSDLEIAREAERRFGKQIAQTNHAREAVVSRYRRSKAYKTWLRREQDKEIATERSIREVRGRLKLIRKMVESEGLAGFEASSRLVQARMLEMATAASDDELKFAFSPKGWAGTAFKLVRETLTDKWRQQVEDLKAEIRRLAAKPKAKGKVDMKAVVDVIDKAMGLAK
jgi:hypothetical protein